MKAAHDEHPEDNTVLWEELKKRAARIEALEAQLREWEKAAEDTHWKNANRIEALEAALREIADVRDGVPWNAVAIARDALAPEQDK